MYSLEDALKLNNEGVSLLLDSKDTEAVIRLRESLTMFQQILQEHNTSNKRNLHSSSPASSTERNNSTAQQPMMSEKHCPSIQSNNTNDISFQVINEPSVIRSQTVSVPYLQNDYFFMYDKAILFDTIAILSSKQPPQYGDIHIFIATVILNVALAYHRQLSLGKKQHMAKTKAMYEMASKLLIGKQFDMRYKGTAFLVSLAALNNLSLISHDEGNYDTSTQGFQRLAVLLSTTQNYYRSYNLQDVICNDIVVGMSLNVVFANNRPTMAGAA